ncbi:phage tail protein [Spirosoma fluviale]|uniref:Microcystin-dependent protein n=1 Tax=Spirosoma fluviale TaxID=1597977 RepID=A0A286GCI0_9BACT|nr:tail fiber protein [Spirosoma fluviale]SOD93233.1 Microcystin-dependent protein [Spirosoma fluviale]
MEPYIGQIQAFGFNFAPKGWAFCNGQLLPIAQYQALFSLLGTTYGGNGTTTFALPNLQGRAPIHFGQGPGLSFYDIGEMIGTENVTLLQSQMPAHNHTLGVSTEPGSSNSPAGKVSAVVIDGSESAVNAYGSSINSTASAQAIGMAGNNAPVSVMQPVIAINYCIALEGIYPSRP